MRIKYYKGPSRKDMRIVGDLIEDQSGDVENNIEPTIYKLTW